MSVQAYAAYNKDEAVRKVSSSGGIFYEIAVAVLEKQGMVFGARYDESWDVVHGHTENLEGLKDFIGSKYAQSAVGKEYTEMKRQLNLGKFCLFSGTPCQIAGLKAYLGKEYNNLMTVDFICHGVPSRAVWREYIKYRRGKKSVKDVSFRDKTEGWLKFSLKIDFKDGSIYRKTQEEDLYMQGFLKDIYLRPSCYECAFKGIDRNSDITLADYWGVQKDIPEIFDDKGTSVVFIHSEMGQKIWQHSENKLVSYIIDSKAPLVYNSAAVQSIMVS